MEFWYSTNSRFRRHGAPDHGKSQLSPVIQFKTACCSGRWRAKNG